MLTTLKRRSPSNAKPASLLSLGFSAEDSLVVLRLVREGLPFARLAHFQKFTRLTWEKIAKLISVPPRTLTRRQANGRLDREESDRVLRLAAIVDAAVKLFEGDVAAALQWLESPQRALHGETPLEYSTTSIGAKEVEHLITRLEHGVFS